MNSSNLLNIWRYLRNPKTGHFPKILAIAALAYILWPADLIPDLIPFIGWLDDLGLTALALWYLSHVTNQPK